MMSNESVTEDEDDLLPASLAVWKFTAARGKEVQIMKRALRSSGGVKLAFQKLPKHMRRKATAHNVKRLPRRLREIHRCQMRKSGPHPLPKQKRPSRRYKRRPCHLAGEYERRRRRIVWLGTHLWHAKRFHMVEKWGYSLPDRPCDKAFRACFRASAHHSLLQDISYYSCVEITGDFATLNEGFRLVTNHSSGLTFTAKAFIDGRREASWVDHAEIRFLGNKNIYAEFGSDPPRHGRAYAHSHTMFIVYSHIEHSTHGNTILYSFSDKGRAIGQVRFIWRPDSGTKRRIWIWLHPAFYEEALETFKNCLGLNPKDQQYCSHDDGIELIELKYELSRFRLTGPISNAILQHSFKLQDPYEDLQFGVSFGKEERERIVAAHDYWRHLQAVSSPAELSPGAIVPLLIQDPRFNFPKKRTKALPKATESQADFDIESTRQLDSNSPIWDSGVRILVSESKMSQAKFMELRAKLLVPGSDIEQRPASLPVILVQVPGSSDERYGFASGWDVILPASWSQPTWLSLVSWGARAGGLRESNSINFECGRQDLLYPDTSSGASEEGDLTSQCRGKFFRLPPNNRVNYNKFNISSPFAFNWRLLVSEWSGVSEGFVVLRDRKLLRSLKEMVSSKNVKLSPSFSDIPENSLIPVCVKLEKKGPCRRFALICLPLEEDLNVEPMERNCVDPNEHIRKRLKEEHKVVLKRLRRGRVRAKNAGKVTTPTDEKILTSYSEKMRQLWLPETRTIRNSCSREVMGFIKQGGFSFAIGKTKGIGYITACALKQLLSQRTRYKVLVRNTNSRQYRLGNLEVICD